MSTRFKQTVSGAQNEPASVREIHVTRLDGVGEMVVQEFDAHALHQKSEREYTAVKKKFGPLAATDHERVNRNQKDSRFAMSPLLRDPLSINEEERRVIEARVAQAVADTKIQAQLEGEKKGYEDGLARGKEEALAIFRNEAQVRLQQVDQIIVAMESAKKRIFEENEKLIFEMIQKICKRLIMQNIKEDQDYILRLARRLMESLETRDSVTVKIHPTDLGSLELLKEGLGKSFSDLKNLKIEALDSIPVSSCRVETDSSIRVASIDQQLEEILKNLTQETAPQNEPKPA